MGSLLDHHALLHHYDFVSIDDCAQPVGDHDNGLLLILEKLVKSLLDLELTLCVQGTRGLVEEQDAGLADQGTSNRNPLLLAA